MLSLEPANRYLAETLAEKYIKCVHPLSRRSKRKRGLTPLLSARHCRPTSFATLVTSFHLILRYLDHLHSFTVPLTFRQA